MLPDFFSNSVDIGWVRGTECIITLTRELSLNESVVTLMFKIIVDVLLFGFRMTFMGCMYGNRTSE